MQLMSRVIAERKAVLGGDGRVLDSTLQPYRMQEQPGISSRQAEHHRPAPP